MLTSWHVNQSFCHTGDRWVLVKKHILEEATSQLNPNTNQESAGFKKRRDRQCRQPGSMVCWSWLRAPTGGSTDTTAMGHNYISGLV